METTENYFRMPTVPSVGEMNVSSSARLSAITQPMVPNSIVHPQLLSCMAAGTDSMIFMIILYTTLSNSSFPCLTRNKRRKKHPRGLQ